MNTKNNSYTLLEIKDKIFVHQLSKYPCLEEFTENPYTYIKARYYMYCSVLLVYCLLRTRITPNAVTIAYILSGVFGGALLATPNIYCNVAGVLVFFNKGILDWSDGHLARIKYQPSLTGRILDEYGAVINSIGFTIGLGFFAVHQTGNNSLFYIIPIIPILHGYKYTSFAKMIILDNSNNILKEQTPTGMENQKDVDVASSKKEKRNNSYHPFIEYFRNFLDDRARTVDFILLLLCADLYYHTNLVLYVVIIITIKLLAQSFISIFFGVRSRVAESIVDEIKE